MDNNRQIQTRQGHFLGTLFGNIFGLPTSFIGFFRREAATVDNSDAQAVSNLVNQLKENELFNAFFEQNRDHNFTLQQLQKLQTLSQSFEQKLEEKKTQLTRSTSELLQLRQPDDYLEAISTKKLIPASEEKNFTAVQLELLSTLLKKRMDELAVAYTQKLTEEKSKLEDKYETTIAEKDFALRKVEREKNMLSRQLEEKDKAHEDILTTQKNKTDDLIKKHQEAHNIKLQFLNQEHAKAVSKLTETIETNKKHYEQSIKEQLEIQQQQLADKTNNYENLLSGIEANLKKQYDDQVKTLDTNYVKEKQKLVDSATKELAIVKEEYEKEIQEEKRKVELEKKELQQASDSKIQERDKTINELRAALANQKKANALLLESNEASSSFSNTYNSLTPIKPEFETEQTIAWQAGKTNMKRFFPRSSYKAMRKVLRLINPEDKPFAKIDKVSNEKDDKELVVFNPNYHASLLRLAITVLMQHDKEKSFADILNGSDYVKGQLKNCSFPLSEDNQPDEDDTSENATILRALNEVALMEREDYAAFNRDKCSEFSNKGVGYSKKTVNGEDAPKKYLSSCLPSLQIVRVHETFSIGRFFPFNNEFNRVLLDRASEHKDHTVPDNSTCTFKGYKHG
ncbi:MAG: hypothetical protein ACX932_04620 [Gammaproteobacteria bacterium]